MTTKITRAKIAQEMKSKFGLPKKYCEDTVNGIFENIAKTLNEDKDVAIRGFGSFKVMCKKERVNKSPLTNQEHIIKARKVCSFYAYNRLKNIVKSNTNNLKDKLKDDRK